MSATNVRAVAEAHLCAQCGACAAVCPVTAIEMIETPAGLLEPRVDENECTECGECLVICPGRRIDLPSDDVADAFRGKVLAAYLGHAADPLIRASGQSGGLVTALLDSALQTGAIDAALVTEMPGDGRLRPSPLLARSRTELLASQASKYCPVATVPALRDARPGERVAAVGLPCQVQALRDLQAAGAGLAGGLKWSLGLFCDRTLSYLCIDLMAKDAGIPLNRLRSVAYRSRARSPWPGEVRFVGQDDSDQFFPASLRMNLKEYCTPSRCRLCPLKMNPFADLAIGDPWGWPVEEMGAGESVVLVRSERGAEILEEALRMHAIELRSVEAEKIFIGQHIDARKQEVASFLAAWQAEERPLPAFSGRADLPAPMPAQPDRPHWNVAQLRFESEVADSVIREAALERIERQRKDDQSRGGPEQGPAVHGVPASGGRSLRTLLARIRLSPADICKSRVGSTDLASRSIRGGLTTIVSQVAAFVIQLGGTAVLARLLTPTDYGLLAMVAVVITFAGMFKSVGLSAATVQRSVISRDQISSLFWINLGVGILLAACVAAVSPLVARFYDRQELTAVTALLALSLVLSGATVQHDAVLRRHLRFAGLALAGIASSLIGLALSIVLAVKGYGYWALVWGPLAAGLAGVALTFSLCPWVPAWIKRGSNIRSMLRFGANVTGFDFVNYFARNLDNILIGRFLGAAPLAFYSKAYTLFLLPVTQIREPVMAVGMPVLSSLQDDPERYAKYFNRMTDILATLVMPLTALVFVEAEFFVRVFLGSQWGEVVPLFRVLAIAGMVQGVTATRGFVLVSMGLTSRHLRWGIMHAVVVCASFVAGLNWGTMGVAAAYTVANYVILVPSLFYCFHGTPVSVSRFLKTLPLPGLLAVVAGGAAYGTRLAIGADSVAGNLIAIVVFVLLYVGASSFRPLVHDTLKRVATALMVGGGRSG